MCSLPNNCLISLDPIFSEQLTSDLLMCSSLFLLSTALNGIIFITFSKIEINKKYMHLDYHSNAQDLHSHLFCNLSLHAFRPLISLNYQIIPHFTGLLVCLFVFSVSVYCVSSKMIDKCLLYHYSLWILWIFFIHINYLCFFGTSIYI